MRVVVDLNRCQGYAQCCFAAPTAFKMHNEEALEYDPAPGRFAPLHDHAASSVRAAPAHRLDQQPVRHTLDPRQARLIERLG